MMEITALNVQSAMIILLWLEYFWDIYLSYRQYQVYQTTRKPPSELENIMTQELFNETRSYSLDKSRFHFITTTFSILLSTAILYSGVLADLWFYCESIIPIKGEVAISCIWIFILTTVLTIIELPLNIYYTFILEEKHGFNKQTKRFFVFDRIKLFILSQTLSLPIASLIVVIVKYGGQWFFVWLWLVVGSIAFILLAIYPSYIAPLFDKFTPLPDGELKTKIENLASEVQFPLKELFIVEGSKRSAHSNAYFSGLFGSKRVVLFDTLLAKPESGGCQDEEILAILCHEFGHWKHGHMVKNIILLQVNLLVLFLLFSQLFGYAYLYRAVGFPVNLQPVIVGLYVVYQYCLIPFNLFQHFVSMCISRKFEYEADNFAMGLGYSESLQTALIQLTKDNLGFPIYDPLYSSWYLSHPPLLERLAALKKKLT